MIENLTVAHEYVTSNQQDYFDGRCTRCGARELHMNHRQSIKMPISIRPEITDERLLEVAHQIAAMRDDSYMCVRDADVNKAIAILRKLVEEARS